MTGDELIGKVAACYLRDRLSENDSTGVARYLLDCLTADQTAAVAKTILADAMLSKLIEIKLPIHFVGSHGLPQTVLTKERTTYYRRGWRDSRRDSAWCSNNSRVRATSAASADSFGKAVRYSRTSILLCNPSIA